MSQYCTAAEMIRCYDSRRVGQLLEDAGVQISGASITNSETLRQLLEEASEMILAAAMPGKRYTRAQLDTLYLTTGGAMLRRLCADITMGLLVARRGYYGEEAKRHAPRYDDAMGMLQLLRDGERIFDVEGVPEAGLPTTAQLSRQINSSLVGCASRVLGAIPITGTDGCCGDGRSNCCG